MTCRQPHCSMFQSSNQDRFISETATMLYLMGNVTHSGNSIVLALYVWKGDSDIYVDSTVYGKKKFHTRECEFSWLGCI